MSTEEVYVTSSEEWSQKATITLTPSSEEWSGEAAITCTPGCLAEPEANHHGPAQNADQPTQ